MPAKTVLFSGENQLSIHWQTAGGAEAYEVWYNTTEDAESAIRFGGDVTGTSTVVTGLTNGTAYYIWVRGKSASVIGKFSPPSCGIPGFYFTAGPTLTAGDHRIEASWTALPGATAYQVWYCVWSNPLDAVQYGGDIADISAAITDSTGGQTFYVWVCAKKGAGTSGFSPASSARTLGSKPQPIGFNAWTPGDLSSAEERWYSFNAISGATYNIYWDDSLNGSGAYTCNVKVSAYHADGRTVYFTDYNSGYNTPGTITAAASELVYIKVQGYTSFSSGTFAVRVTQP
ncbi:MAG: fibronectin type III domain-containing protein [Spirochaetales bacterium]|nr:fibronectin type III domain-containing protein [Spirochaetales bacterium]